MPAGGLSGHWVEEGGVAQAFWRGAAPKVRYGEEEEEEERWVGGCQGERPRKGGSMR